MAKHRTTRWVIVNKRTGITYCGASQMRQLAIAAHVNDYDADLYKERRSGWGGLSARQKEVWKECRKNGDRAVKAEIVWED